MPCRELNDYGSISSFGSDQRERHSKAGEVDTKLKIELSLCSSPHAGWLVYIFFENALYRLSLEHGSNNSDRNYSSKVWLHIRHTSGDTESAEFYRMPKCSSCTVTAWQKSTQRKKESRCATRKRPLNWCLDSLKFTEA